MIQEFGQFSKSFHDKTMLVLAGARTDESEAMQKLAREKIGTNFLILENIPHRNMPSLYQAADVFCFCVTHGIFGIALAEAAATGLPCIVHDWKRVSWVAGPHATVIDMTKEGELAAALFGLADPSVRAFKGCATRNWATNALATDCVMNRIVAMYKSIS